SQARVCLARGDPAGALAQVAAWRREAEARHWLDERLKCQVLEALAQQAQGARAQALAALSEALALAEAGGLVRLFVDEGAPMAQLLRAAAEQGIAPDYTARLLAAFQAEPGQGAPAPQAGLTLIEPLSARELEVLRLIAGGRSNQEIGEQLFLALD